MERGKPIRLVVGPGSRGYHESEQGFSAGGIIGR